MFQNSPTDLWIAPACVNSSYSQQLCHSIQGIFLATGMYSTLSKADLKSWGVNRSWWINIWPSYPLMRQFLCVFHTDFKRFQVGWAFVMLNINSLYVSLGKIFPYTKFKKFFSNIIFKKLYYFTISFSSSNKLELIFCEGCGIGVRLL